MALAIDTFHMGPARIFAGVTNPTSGTPPTKVTHTDGVPATGIEIGFTQGDTQFDIMLEKTEVKAEQSLATVEVYSSGLAVVLRGSMLEANYTALKIAIDAAVSSVDDGTHTTFYGGGGTGILAPTKQSVMFTARQPKAPTKFWVGLIYNAYTKKGATFTFGKTTQQAIQFELHGCMLLTRNDGDQLFQFFREK